MASAILHIKDSYYFEVPHFMWRSQRAQRENFPAFWVRLDPEYQTWAANREFDALKKSTAIHTDQMPDRAALLREYQEWRDDHANYAKPFDVFLEQAPSQEWLQKQLTTDQGRQAWQQIKAEANDVVAYEKSAPAWSADKIAEYNHQLDGKILIPQPFGDIKNFYEKQSGFAISKFMILELLVAAILCLIFVRLGKRMQRDVRPRGKAWNGFEAILLYFRDNVARPAIGGHDADRFVPFLWTLFLFILGCNLIGIIPWLGAPTGAFGVTLGLACATFATVLIFGMKKFGVIGFWKNLVPNMGLPWYMAIIIVPAIFAIEVLSLCIKHGVLAVRLLANMVAGHLVLLAVMGLAVAAAGSSTWGLTAVISVVGSALFSCLELFVAFLQAYVFTFLSALFIGLAIHHH
jgi:F-type H+-transporting ATPase subunit a